MERSRALVFGLLALFGISLSACNFYHEKHPKSAYDLSQANLSYATVSAEIFTPQCIACHNGASAKGGIVLDHYEAIKTNLRKIENAALIAQTMPRTRPLAPVDRELLRAWILAGAPREGATPPPPPTALQPTFTSIRKLVFEAKCVACHTPGEAGGKIPLDDYSLLMNSPRDLVLPGNDEESGLVVSLERTDDHQMPPTESGLGRVSDADLHTIRAWIKRGAPND